MNMQVYNLGEVSQATYKKGPRALYDYRSILDQSYHFCCICCVDYLSLCFYVVFFILSLLHRLYNYYVQSIKFVFYVITIDYE